MIRAMTEGDLSELLGELLKNRRLALELPQDGLAARAGVSQSSVSRVESGQQLTINSLTRLLPSLGVRAVIYDRPWLEEVPAGYVSEGPS